MTVQDERAKLFASWNDPHTKPSEFNAVIDAFERAVRDELVGTAIEMLDGHRPDCYKVEKVAELLKKARSGR